MSGAACSLPPRQQKAREAKRQRRLADAARPGEQDRMRQPLRPVQPLQLELGRLVTDEIRVRPR